jgi:hypothetical protein
MGKNREGYTKRERRMDRLGNGEIEKVKNNAKIS